LLLLAAAVTASSPALADEGMWPFDLVPVARIAQDHHVALSPAWLDHVRLASVRFNSGGSGSFVSPHGLVLTNHHVAADCVSKVASSAHDYLTKGYLAGKNGDEIPCPDLELDQLQSIEDVTARVQAARQPGMTDADANKAMKAQMAALEKDCPNGLRCDVVTLYAGAMYRLYRYRRFTDVRLVFAPEAAIAFFGGDPDNFNYPRYDLDLALFRVHVAAGKPLDSQAFYLPWSARGPKDGDVVFTSGHPGRTDRDDTVAQLETLRDVAYPRMLARLTAWREGLTLYAKSGAEADRQARESIFGVENALKAYRGFEGGLRDPALLQKKRDEEAALRKGVAANAELKAKYGTAWDEVARVQKAYIDLYPRLEAYEAAVRGSLLNDARDLVRLAAQSKLPNEQRLPEFRETQLDELKSHVLAPAAIYPGVEAVFVERFLALLQAAAGKSPDVRRPDRREGTDANTDVVQVLAGRTPERAAREIVAQSKLFDVYARRALWDGGQAAVDASTDPLVVAMRTLEPAAIAVRKQFDDGVEAPMRSLGRKVAEAKFAVVGTSVAPDATFTLRLAVGVVRGYEERGQHVPWATDFSGLYRHATGVDPLKLPERWVQARGSFLATAGATPMNFVSTNDIVGGNSGSPVVGVSGELVGLIFDGNLPSLPNRFVYEDRTARAVSVDTAAILEALRSVYGAASLVQELAGPPMGYPAGQP
jgi:hypothetical protein